MKIGILGGLSYQSTIYYYKKINEMYYKIFKSFPEIIINSINMEKFNKLIFSGDIKGVKSLLLNSINLFKKVEVEIVLISSNTPHFVFEEIKDKFKVPVISIVDTIYNNVREFGLKKVLLLGTRLTMEDGFYQRYFSERGIEIIIPEPLDREYIQGKLFNELVKGIISDETREEFYKIIKDNLNRKIEGVILGCTEIPLLISEPRFNLKFFDSGLLHCKELIKRINS